jgi:hypothetical protein
MLYHTTLHIYAYCAYQFTKNKEKDASKGTSVKPLVSTDGKLPLESSGGAKPLEVHGKSGCIDTVELELNPFTDNACEKSYR